MTKPPFDSAPHVSEDRCLDLVQRLLAADTRRTTLEHLRACPACEARFQEVAASHTRARSAVTSMLQHPAAIVPLRAIPRRATAIWMAAAAIAAAVIGVTWFSQRPSATSTILAQADSQLPVARLRGAIRGLGSTAADSSVMAGLEAYNRKNMLTARRRLETARVTGSMDAVRRVYLGSTLLELGDAAGARDVLRGMREADVPEPWKSESRWTLAIALARSGDAATADSLLNVLAQERGPVADRARVYRTGPLRSQR